MYFSGLGGSEDTLDPLYLYILTCTNVFCDAVRLFLVTPLWSIEGPISIRISKFHGE